MYRFNRSHPTATTEKALAYSKAIVQTARKKVSRIPDRELLNNTPNRIVQSVHTSNAMRNVWMASEKRKVVRDVAAILKTHREHVRDIWMRALLRYKPMVAKNAKRVSSATFVDALPETFGIAKTTPWIEWIPVRTLQLLIHRTKKHRTNTARSVRKVIMEGLRKAEQKQEAIFGVFRESDLTKYPNNVVRLVRNRM